MLRKTLQHRTPELAGALLAVIIGAIIFIGREYSQELSWARRSIEIQAALNDFEAAIRTAEGGQRGFLLTNNELYLSPYRQGVEELPGIITRLENLLADDPVQLAEYGILKLKTADRMARLARTLNARRTGDEETVKAALASHRGFDAMLGVQQSLKKLEKNEQQLLEERSQAAGQLRAYFIVGLVVGMLTLVASLWSWVVSLRRSRTALEKANEALEASLRDQRASAEQVRQLQKMEAIGQLAGGIAHDFNNMLAVILGGLALIKRRIQNGDANIMSFVEACAESATRAATLTSRLTAFSRQMPLNPEPINANKLVGGMSDMLSRSIGESIRTETVLAGGLWFTNADAAQLESAILNLCVNARDAMPDGGRLTIETANFFLDDAYGKANGVAAGQYVLIAVTDTGTGMTPEVMAKAFDPFFTTKAVGKGSGLGLSQVHGFAKQSGGHLKIYSEVGQGTTAKIYLPRYIPVGSEKSSATPPPVEPNGRSSANQLILVVEDDASVRASTGSLLREIGYRIIYAEGAKAAMAALAEHSDIDLMFTDIVMPDTNGRVLADEALRLYPKLKVLFTTGFTRNAIVHNGTLDQGVDFIAKPFTLDQLAEKLEQVFSRASQGS